MKKKNGFILVFLIVLLPVLMFIGGMTSWSIWFAYQKQKNEKICYEHLLRAQTILIKSSRSLLALNPRAKLLMAEKSTWQRILLTAPPPVKAVALANIKRIRLQQQILNLKQRGIIAKGYAQVNLELFKLQRILFESLKQTGETWSKSKTFPQIHFSSKKPQVEPELRGPAPPYRLKFNYRSKQELSASWRVNLKNDGNPLLFDRFGKGLWSSSCQTHPSAKGGTWRATIGRARYSSK